MKKMPTYHKAPWGKTLFISTVLCTLLLVGLAINGMFMGGVLGWIVAASLLLMVVGCAIFSIFGYSVTPDAILVHRPFWKTTVSLDGLKSVESFPHVMRKSWRTFGNGGFFSITGFFKNETLGSYRAFVTDLRRTVVLRYDAKVVVLSPADPEAFVREVELKAEASRK